MPRDAKINAIFEFSDPFCPRVVSFLGKREIMIFHSFPPWERVKPNSRVKFLASLLNSGELIKG